MKKLKIGKKSGLRYFSYGDIKSWGPCYDPNRFIKEDWRGTAIDILDMENVSVPDRLWVVLRTELVSEKCMRLFAVWSARQVQHLMKDPRSTVALDVSERFANGEATQEELDAAGAAARDAAWAAAGAAAGAAARDAAWAAAGAAAGAAGAAAGAAGAAQIAKLKEMIIIEGQERKGKK